MYIKINEEVKSAIANKKPVVALESTIISHGMPYPENVKTALMVEQIIRDNGAIPATIGIIDGVAIVGMNKDEIELFGKRKGIDKVSRRDIPYIMSHKKWGATTVATTMIFANMAGIEVFVTGGVGGVHKGAQQTFDISADLQELSNTNVTVVCAGAKAILDLPLTLEYLETFGVPVIGFQTKELPAFYTRESGLSVDYKGENENDIARIIKCKRDLSLKGGILVTNPIPTEYSANKEEIDNAINKALELAKENNIHGKETTPFLLKTVKELTNGDSLEANIALIYNNAKIGAKIAVEYSKL